MAMRWTVAAIKKLGTGQIGVSLYYYTETVQALKESENRRFLFKTPIPTCINCKKNVCNFSNE